MKRYILFLLTLLAFSSCGEDEISMLSAPCNQDLVCTEELRYLSYKAMLDGKPVVLDNYYVKNLDNGNLYQESSLNDHLDEGQYVVVSDVRLSEIKKTGTILRFFGIKNNEIVLQQDFTVGHDCCHIIPLSGPFVEQ
ncbi:hypothetical protein [Roseivirga spongicola]|uniref:Lipoprotein n=1 Tax=Roseivirga spongicola TaxID=333140 RepID=A0A150X5R8_9BACT|nr:hypothetical protein [Roseivirga spongicola]KYG74077.1 hypothetical protein AWW68_15580 [Roseivirga spongicola]WPZ09273.1 hypothetical protein T7867_13500 [Roseivirga spongicola]